MTWAEQFYSTTGAWWGEAEAVVKDVDRLRASFVRRFDAGRARVLELGCGYGSTASAIADVGYEVTAVDLSDRIEIARQVNRHPAVTLVRDDFYTADLSASFDLVCYWDGFGVGTDEDQRRLLRRVAEDWLTEGGSAVIEVFNPVAWAAEDGREEIKPARPDVGYLYTLGHRRHFDALHCRALDTWWEVASGEEWTQSLRCYSPQDLELLVEPTGLTIHLITTLDGETTDLGPDAWSYIAVMSRCNDR